MRFIPSFTTEQIMSEEWEINMSKKHQNFNTSEGNVKDNNIFYKECCDKFIDYVKKSHNERVANTSKTIDHIADVSKKVSLTKLWRKGELKTGWYYVKNEFGSIFVSEYSKGYDHINERIEKDFFTEDSDITEIICEVPSYKEYDVMKYRSSRFSVRHFEQENQKLKELLKECRGLMNMSKDWAYTSVTEKLLTKIDEVLND